MPTYPPETVEAAFAASQAEFTRTVTWLASDTDGLTHGEIETRQHAAGLKVFRQFCSTNSTCKPATNRVWTKLTVRAAADVEDFYAQHHPGWPARPPSW